MNFFDTRYHFKSYDKFGALSSRLPKDARATVTFAAVGEQQQQRWSPLHLAAMRDHTAAVELLVNRKADYQAKVREGKVYAVEVIRFLVIFCSLH